MDKSHFDRHTSAQYNAELEEARKNLMQMGGLVEQQVEDALGVALEAELADSVGQRVLGRFDLALGQGNAVDPHGDRRLVQRDP